MICTDLQVGKSLELLNSVRVALLRNSEFFQSGTLNQHANARKHKNQSFVGTSETAESICKHSDSVLAFLFVV
jgi:hypothetical protein